MARKPNPPRDDPEQSERFIKKAREIEVNESKEAFERVLDKVISVKSPKRAPSR